MPSSHFEFRKFTIRQERSAMKVTTDACLFGAWIPLPEEGRVLDIGSGTGLLSLMAAQRTSCHIEAVELDADSFLQSKENFEASNWAGRLHAVCSDINRFDPGYTYDFIMSNPPFFMGQLTSGSPQKNKARHATTLHAASLVKAAGRLLNREGSLAVLLPPESFKDLEKCAAQLGLFRYLELQVHRLSDGEVFRKIGVFSFHPVCGTIQPLFIHEKGGTYSMPFKQLLSPFYPDNKQESGR